jgi:hypothetical protein
MKRVIDIELALAHQLVDRLEAASVPASVIPRSTARGGADPAGLATVWVPDDADPALVREVVAGYLEHIASTRTEVVCANCGYDLRGHDGRATCPECGQEIVAPVPDVTCTSCGEQVPAGFGICWSCGGDMEGQRGTDDA